MTAHYLLRKTLLALAQLGVIVLLLFLWQYGADHHAINTSFFSKPSDIWHYLKVWGSTSTAHQPRYQNTGTTLWSDLWATVTVFGLGYLIGTALGIVSGILIGTIRVVREIVDPFIVFCNAVPRIVLLPALVILFGFGLLPQVLLVILVIFFLVTIQIATGVQETPRNLLNNVRSLGASKFELVRYVYIPSLMIWVLSTARVVIGYAVQAAIAAEFIGADKGLGYRFVNAQSEFLPAEMFASFAVVLFLALVVDMALAGVEKRSSRWMP